MIAKILGLSSIGFCFLSGAQAYAIDSFGYGDLSSLDQSSVGALIQTVVVGGAHRSFSPVSPVVTAGGFEVGLDYTVFSTSQDFALGMRRAGVSSSIPDNIAMTHLLVRKSFPGNFGAALSLGGMGSNHSFGLEAEYRWTGDSIDGLLLASRVSYTSMSYFFVDASLLKTESLLSHKIIGIFEVYAGVAVGAGSGELQVPKASLPTGIDPTSKEFMVTYEGGFTLQVGRGKFGFLYETGWDNVRAFGTQLSYAF